MKESMLRNPLVLPVYIPTLLIAFGQGMLVPILPLYATSFHASYGLVGLVLASQGLGTLIGDVPAGLLLSKLGQRWSMLLGIGSLALAMLAMSWAHSLLELFVYGLGAGIGGALWNISRHAYLTHAAPVYRRGRAIAIFGGINRVGSFAGPALGGTLGALFGLRMPFVVYAVLTAVSLIFPALFAVESTAMQAPQRGGLKGHTGHLWALLKSQYKILLSAGVGQLFAQMIRSGRNIVVPLYGANVLGLDVQSVGLIMSVGSAIDMSMFYPAGMIMDRFGRKYAYVPCFLIQAIGMALIPLTGSFVTLLAATGLIGFGNGLGSGTMMTLGADLAPRDSMGEFLGMWRLIGDGGQSAGPIAVGAIADLLGLGTAIFVIAGVGMLAAAILGLLVPETLHQPRAPAQAQT